MVPNPHPTGVVPFLKGVHFDQAGHVTGTMVLRGETVPIDCYSVRDRSWGPRPLGRPRARTSQAAGSTEATAGTFGGVGYSFCASGPGEAWLTYAVPGPEAEPVSCGFLLRGGAYGHILAGERRVTFDAATGWPLTFAIEAVDESTAGSRCGRRRQPALARPRRGTGWSTGTGTTGRTVGARTRATSAATSGKPTGGVRPGADVDVAGGRVGRPFPCDVRRHDNERPCSGRRDGTLGCGGTRGAPKQHADGVGGRTARQMDVLVGRFVELLGELDRARHGATKGRHPSRPGSSNAAGCRRRRPDLVTRGRAAVRPPRTCGGPGRR